MYSSSPSPPGMSLMGCMGFFFSFLFVEEKLFHRRHGETTLPFSGGKISASFVHLYFCVNGVVRERACAWGMRSLTCLTDKTHHAWQHKFNDFPAIPVGEEGTEMREREMHTVQVESAFPALWFFLGAEASRLHGRNFSSCSPSPPWVLQPLCSYRF